MPLFQEAYEKYAGQFELVVICKQDTRDPSEYIAEHGFTFPFYWDVTASEAFDLSRIPRTVFYDKDGRMSADYVNRMLPDEFYGELEKIL